MQGESNSKGGYKNVQSEKAILKTAQRGNF